MGSNAESGRSAIRGMTRRSIHPAILALDMPADHRLNMDKALRRRLRQIRFGLYLTILLLKLKKLRVQVLIALKNLNRA